MRIRFIGLCAFGFFSLNAVSNEKPVVDISAKGGMEIDDAKQTIEAHQEIVVKRGNQLLQADHAKAHFTKGEQKKIAIQQLEVWGHVVIEESPRKIHADRATYNIPQDTITLTGNPVTFVEPGIKMIAYEKIIYSPKAKQAQAFGNVKIEKENQTLMADEVIAYMEEDASQKSTTEAPTIHGKTKLKKMVAKGNVKIILPDQVAIANYGEHDEDQGKTYLEGDVELSDSKGQIQGGYAEITTDGISRVLQHKPGYDKSSKGTETDRVEALILRT